MNNLAVEKEPEEQKKKQKWSLTGNWSLVFADADITL